MTIDTLIAKKYLALMTSANSRNIEFDLTLADVRKLLTVKKCYYSGVILTDEIDSDNQRSVDRIDNDKGYITGNVVACSRYLNRIKANLTTQDIIYLYKGLKKKAII